MQRRYANIGAYFITDGAGGKHRFGTLLIAIRDSHIISKISDVASDRAQSP